MKLRGRLALVVLATTVPLIVGAAFAMRAVWDRFAVHALRASVVHRMLTGGREECERSPETFSLPRETAGASVAAAAPPADGHAPGVMHTAPRVLLPAADRAEVFAYSVAFVSENRDAPAFPAALRDALRDGAESAETWTGRDGRRTLVLAVRMAWDDGPCAIVLARQEVRPDPRAEHDLIVGSALVGLGLVVAVLVAAGPPVARIRALAARVRGSGTAQEAPAIQVGGTDEIADLARAFDAAAAEVRAHVEALERREATLREFVANTDHDLTIPLTVLLGHLSDLQRSADAGEAVDPARLRDAAREADYMASLVRNLGVAARLEAGEPAAARAPVDLNALVGRVVARHRPLAEAARVSLEFAVPEATVVADGDETLLEQAASNLVHNAVRHNRAGGHVAVTLDAPRPESGASAGEFVLRVSDDGPGLPADECARLAAPDDRSAGARSRAAGTGGLGLRIVQRIAERHGLRLHLAPRDGGGLVAELRGPLRAV